VRHHHRSDRATEGPRFRPPGGGLELDSSDFCSAHVFYTARVIFPRSAAYWARVEVSKIADGPSRWLPECQEPTYRPQRKWQEMRSTVVLTAVPFLGCPKHGKRERRALFLK